MLRNMEVDHLMTSILLELMPLSVCEPHNELWKVYNQLQEWKLAFEWEHSGIGTDRTNDIADSIVKNLDTLHNHELAQEIERVLRRNTSSPVPTTTFVAAVCTAFGVWTIPSPLLESFRCSPSSLYTFRIIPAWLGIGISKCWKRSPNLGSSTLNISEEALKSSKSVASTNSAT